MTIMTNDAAIQAAEQYRDQVVASLRAMGYTCTNSLGWDGGPNPDCFVVSGEPEVRFSLLARSARKYMSSREGCPDLEFHGSGRRTAHWRKPDRGWSPESAAKHAGVLAEYVQEYRAADASRHAHETLATALEQRAAEINARLGDSAAQYPRFSAGRDGSALAVMVRYGNIRAPEDQLEPLIRDLRAVLQRYGVK